MVRNNNMIPNGHFHKKWKRHVRTWFDQPAKKVRRNLRRARKAKKVSPRPIELLRPIVRCQSVRYHTKLRKGRGFTLRELKAAGLNKRYARTIGIAVEYRRKNKSHESLLTNVQRLEEYVAKLIVYPQNNRKAKLEKPDKIAIDSLNVVKQVAVVSRARAPTEQEKKSSAYVTLRKARGESRKLSRKTKRKTKDDGMEIDKK